jgi:hypothetical protein
MKARNNPRAYETFELWFETADARWVLGDKISQSARNRAMKSKHKAQKVAKWMLEELKRQHKLHQDTLVYEIAQKFGSQFTYATRMAT